MDNTVIITYTQRGGLWEKKIHSNYALVFCKGFCPLEEFQELKNELDKNFPPYSFLSNGPELIDV